MQFGIGVSAHVNNWEFIRYAEELGYDRAWVGDSQMIWSDCYATLALAAHHTTRIQLGTGVSIAGTRIAPVTAHSIASIAALAPGRVFLGLGTGHTAMRVMGQDPMRVKAFREYLRVVRSLLDGAAVDYTYDGKTREIQFLHRDRRFLELGHRIPIYVAANGPRALAAAGEFGDGFITVGGEPEVFTPKLDGIRAGAAKAGRTLGDDFHTAFITTSCVLGPGDSLSDERVIDETGSWVGCELHFYYEVWKDNGENDDLIPDHFRDAWPDYLERVRNMKLPPDARFREIHDGHLVYLQPDERRFVTPAAIEKGCLVGEPDAIIEHVRRLEAAGIGEIALWPPMDCERKVLEDFARHVMPAFR
ncbi:MAG: LLM class flavin-dependent oxidoreductase [Gammaproteobacteria bacterium]|nr:LLM class flavin-dependent oxidoreductase [Gammaproteobacteria bacterium]MCP5199556.1 LLM class flavin-dependent oxidoreductase [Gammaproteobacteria bacterium]